MNNLELKKFRDRYNLTQSDISKIVGSSIRAVQSWEQGQRNIPQSAIKLLEVFEQKNSDTFTNSATTNNECKETIELLRKQLEQKDKQIESLLNLLNK